MFLLVQLLNLLSLLIFIDVILSWVQQPHQFPRQQTSQLTEPLYAPLRSVIDPQKTGGLDLSPLILLIGLNILADLLGG